MISPVWGIVTDVLEISATILIVVTVSLHGVTCLRWSLI